MKIVYFTSGISGSGRVVRGISIGNALKRKNINCEYIILNSSSFAHLADTFNISHREIPLENEGQLSKENVHKSILYSTLNTLNPDVLLIDLLWFPLYHFINELDCKKIFLCRQVDDTFFKIELPDNTISFRPEDYDYVFAIEPFKSALPMESVNPLVLRNRQEILSRDDAIAKLKLNSDKKACILSYSGHPGDFEKVKKAYSYLEDSYQMVYTTTYQDGIFPVVDYFNAADLIISGAGYNSFWEVVYLNREAIFVPTSVIFENQERRIKECQEYYFDENGADQLVEIIMNL